MAPLTPSERTLRLICIFTFIPALALLLPVSVITQKKHAGFCLIPMGLSVVWSAIVLMARGKKERRTLLFIGDIMLATYLMKASVGFWSDLNGIHFNSAWIYKHGSYNNSRQLFFMAVVGCYGTIPVLANFLIHVCLTLRSLYYMARLNENRGFDIPEALRNLNFNIFSCPECPRCQHEAAGTSPMTEENVARYTQETGRRVQPWEMAQEPRPSTDDEAARLV